MAIHYDLGERKKRAGVYENHSNAGGSQIVGASNGIAAMTIKSDWGALGKITIIDGVDEIAKKVGSAAEHNTVHLINELFAGGARTVYAIRLGTGGAEGTFTLNDTSETPEACLELATLYPGKRSFKVAVKTNLKTGFKEFIAYDHAAEVERIKIDLSRYPTEVDALALAKSDYFIFKKKEGYVGDGVIALLEPTDIQAGTNPAAYTNEDYGKAFDLLEAYQWNTVNVDVDTAEIQALVTQFAKRVWDEGRKGFAVIGIPDSIDYEERLMGAKSYNDKTVCCVIGSFYIGDVKYSGALAAARIAGMIAAVPSNSSLTHAVITGATDVGEMLTNRQYEESIDAGAIVFSTSQDGVVQIEKAITTFVTPNATDDLGWSKIKRAKIRNELMDRASATVYGLVAKVGNTPDGRATIVKTLSTLLDLMIKEEKLSIGAIAYEDPERTAEGDEAWFVIEADDVDMIEKIYLHYQFRFSALS